MTDFPEARETSPPHPSLNIVNSHPCLDREEMSKISLKIVSNNNQVDHGIGLVVGQYSYWQSHDNHTFFYLNL